MIKQIGDIFIVVSMFFSTTFIIGYVCLSPWWKSGIGRSLLASNAWIMGISWLAFLSNTLAIDKDFTFYVILRTALWLGLPLISIGTFWSLLVKVQIKEQIAIRKRNRRDSNSGPDGTGGNP